MIGKHREASARPSAFSR